MSSVFKKALDFFYDAFPTPEYLSLNPSGIDIASDGIYFMRLKKNKKGLIPVQYEKISFSKNIEISENLTAEDKVIIVAGLNQLKNKYNLKHVIPSIPEQKSYIFKLILPKEALVNVSSYIRYQIEENVPLTANEVNFYYFLTDEINRKGDTGVVVTVFPKKVIDFYTEIYISAGLFPISFCAESVALSYSVIKPEDKTPYLLVRLLPDRATAAILEHGIIQYTTDIRIETSAISASLEGPEATLLKESLNKILIYWFTSKKDIAEHKKIENILLVGHNINNPEVIDFLERTLKINVDIADVWKNCFDIKKHVPEIDQKTASNYAISIGLALKCINHA